MDKKFRDLILSQVESIVHNQPPSRQSLYDLLHVATPDLKLHAVDNTTEREHAYRALKVLIHPDKHAKALKGDDKEMARVTNIFQETSAYYNLCCGTLAMESPGLSSNNSVGAPETVASHRNPTRTTQHMHSASPSRFAQVPASVNTTRTTTTTTTKGGGGASGASSTTSTMTPPRGVAKPRSSSDRPPAYYVSFGANGKLPNDFDAFQQWPYMATMMKAPAENAKLSIQELSWIMACRCINFRGAVVHGQKIGRAYQVAKELTTLNSKKSVSEVFQHFGVTCRTTLKRIQDIKTEILVNGPVVSTSFRCKESLYQSHQHELSRSQLHKVHPLMLVGWKMTSAGELWLCHSVWGDPFEVGVGQFDIDKEVLAPPAATLETIPWQSQGPYLDLNMPAPPSASAGGGNSKDWRELRHMSIGISAKELEVLGEILPGGFQKAISNKTSFVIRDKYKFAYSRRYTLREVTTDNGKWKISVSLAEK